MTIFYHAGKWHLQRPLFETTTETLKTCTKCHTGKPLDDFPIDSRYICGHRPACKACTYAQKVKSAQASLPPEVRTCTVCLIEKPIDDFYKNRSAKGGYHLACKECGDKQSGRKGTSKIRRRRSMVLPPDNKWCDGCQSEKPLEAFSRDATKNDGHHPRCKECVYAGQREYRKTHPTEPTDERRAYERAWRKKHPLSGIQSTRRRHAIKRQATVERVSYERILARDGYHCYICNQDIDPCDLSFDHKIPLRPRHGEPQGSHSEDNIKTAHKVCNYRKINKRFEDLTPWDRRGPSKPSTS